MFSGSLKGLRVQRHENLSYEERTVPRQPPKSVGAAARRRVPDK